MSTSPITVDQGRTTWWCHLVNYVELTKPKISILVLVSVAAAGLIASWGQPDPALLTHALIGTALVAASGSTLNQCIERKRDAHMERTAQRPLPSRRLSASQAISFGLLTGALGFGYLWLLVGGVSALIALTTWTIYVAIYTPLKSRTSWNTMVGAVAGAMPVWIGWSAVGGEISGRAVVLFLIVYFWQFPHFMAIAWIYRRQYAAAGMRMLTVVDPTGRRGATRAVAASLALLPLSFLPAVYNMPAALPFMAIALILGAIQLACALAFLGKRDEASARRLLGASLVYLPSLLFLLTLIPLM